MTYDLVVIGNGNRFFMCFKYQTSISKIRCSPWAVRPFSASTGAGAMANGYTEIEKGPFKDKDEARYLQIGLSTKRKMAWLLNEFNIKEKVVTAKDTIVFQKTSSAFEEFNYANIQKQAHLINALRN